MIFEPKHGEHVFPWHILYHREEPLVAGTIPSPCDAQGSPSPHDLFAWDKSTLSDDWHTHQKYYKPRCGSLKYNLNTLYLPPIGTSLLYLT